jgi:cytochrome c biogenesis protein
VTVVEERPAPPAAPPPGPGRRLWALLRNSWRQLTSMRTALVLLFLLAVAAIPGSIFPQRAVDSQRVTDYYAAHPQLSPWLERLGGFEVYASPWFASIYLLLFTSLIGCVLPRLRDHVRALRQPPPDAPKRFERLPLSASLHRSEAPSEVAATVANSLKSRHFRTKVREQDGGGWTISAEKGHLKETGNLLFHFALLAVLIGVGFGHWYGWHGNRILVSGADQGFCDLLSQYDDSTLGPRVDAADLPNFCMKLDKFDVSYQPETGQPKTFSATVSVSEDNRPDQVRKFTVNDPLRLHGANVHLIGHGYAISLKYTDRFGVAQTKTVPFLPIDGMFTSEGVAQFPDVNIDPKTNKRDPALQMGFEGRYLPTTPTDGSATSTFPAENAPAIFLTAYRGDLGLDVGTPGSVYSLDQGQIATGDLKNVSGARPHELKMGESWTLDDGTKLEFLGTRPYATLAIRYDPTQALILVGAVLGLLGLMLSLGGHRRRVWFRALPDSAESSGGTLLTAGGLPRTDYPGFADEFATLVKAAEEGTS